IVKRLELPTDQEAAKIMCVDLIQTLNEIAEAQTKRDHSDLATYHERFLAPHAQLRFLPDPYDASRRIIPVITMGPKDGKPLVALHAMMLPDLGPREAALFEAHGIQAFFPLRHGALDSNAPDIKPQEHLDDAVRGIAAIAALLGKEKFHLAAMVTSSKIALEYAKLFPERVSGLSFLAACVWKERPDEGARAISKALVTGVKSAAFQWRSITRFMIDDLLGPERFERFIKRHFEEAGPDAEIVNQEARNWPGMERMRYALRSSLASVRHDFLHQDELEWERARDLQVPMIFHHGTEDRIHPIALIERLANGLPTSRVNRVSGGGQLLYYEHFTPIMKEIAAAMKKPTEAKNGG
ncbi:MAG: alpha/beta hydrolase, partial [Sulfitobacter sp.]